MISDGDGELANVNSEEDRNNFKSVLSDCLNRKLIEKGNEENLKGDNDLNPKSQIQNDDRNKLKSVEDTTNKDIAQKRPSKDSIAGISSSLIKKQLSFSKNVANKIKANTSSHLNTRFKSFSYLSTSNISSESSSTSTVVDDENLKKNTDELITFFDKKQEEIHLPSPNKDIKDLEEAKAVKPTKIYDPFSKLRSYWTTTTTITTTDNNNSASDTSANFSNNKIENTTSSDLIVPEKVEQDVNNNINITFTKEEEQLTTKDLEIDKALLVQPKSGSTIFFNPFSQENLSYYLNTATATLNYLDYTKSNENSTAAQQLEQIFGQHLTYKLKTDNTNNYKHSDTIKSDIVVNSTILQISDSRKMSATIPSDSEVKCELVNHVNEQPSSVRSSSVSSPDVSISSLTLPASTTDENTVHNHADSQQSVELNLKKKQKLDEYYRIEEKQANLLEVLAKNVYPKLSEENGRQKLCEPGEMVQVFYVVVELEQLASLVHRQMAQQIRERVEAEWEEKPFFGDILTKYYHYYKVYKAILKRYPQCQLTLSNLLKKKPFSAYLKSLLDAEAENLERVNRLDMLLDRLVDLPRRNTQLLEGYLKLLESDSTEYADMKKALEVLKDIFESSNDALNKMNNFQLCYELQYMFEPPLLNIVSADRQLIKQGPLYKVAKRSGELLLRHLALFNDMLLVCKCDKIRRKLQVKYKIKSSEITIVENAKDTSDLSFRLVSSDQNNEFKFDRLKEKEDWLKAFGKLKDIKHIRDPIEIAPVDIPTTFSKIGVVPPIWTKDDDQKCCSGCKETFTFTRRRHHCRTCGRIYCNPCSNYFLPVQFNDFKEKIRVCRSCHHLLKPVYDEYKSRNKIIVNESEANTETEAPSPSSAIPTSMSALNAISDMFNKLGNKATSQIKNEKTSSSSLEVASINEKSAGEISNKTKQAATAGDTENPTVVMRKKGANKDQSAYNSNSDTSRQSSPLTQEQLNLLGSFYDPISPKADDDSDIETDDDLDEMNSTKSSNNDSFKPKTPPRTKSHSIELKKPVPVHQTQSTNLKLNVKKEMLLGDYGYICKMSIVSQSEVILDDGLASTFNTTEKNKWEREYLVFNSDYTISVCSSSNNTSNPSLIVPLASYKLVSINDTTFSLTLKDQDQMLKKKFKMFETNFEIKFSNKEIKNKWFELIKKEEGIRVSVQKSSE